MAVIGNKLSAPTGQVLNIGPAEDVDGINQRAISLATYVAPEPGYITRIGLYGKRGAAIYGYSRVTLGVWAVNSAGAPLQLLARTARINPSASFADISGPVAWSDPDLGGALTAVRVTAGQRLSFGMVTDLDGVDVSTLPGTTTHYRRVRDYGALPSDPFGTASTQVAAPLALYVDFTPDSAPAVALGVPLAAAAIGTTAPTFTGTFSDPQAAAPTVDRMSAYAIQVRRVDTGALLWTGAGAVFTASLAERTANAFSRVYGGAALTSGPTYEWRAQVADDSGIWSAWAAWRAFTINPQGQVDLADATTPPEKIDVATGTVAWGGRWYHPSGLSTYALRVRVLRQGQVVKLSNDVIQAVASSALPGTPFTVSGAAAGIGTLTPGEYTYQIQGHATDSQNTPWSSDRAFRVNAPPNVPSNLQPPTGASSTSRPLLEWNVSDPDPDDIYGVDDDSEIEITRPNGTVVSVTTAQYDAARGVGYFQTTATEFTTTGTYKWRVRGRDLSAGAVGIGPWSPLRTVDYLVGPVVTITNPIEGETEATSVPVVTWTPVAGQTQFRVRAYMADATSPFKEIVVASTQSSFQIPAGWLANGGDYDLLVYVTTGTGQTGISLRRRFKVAYPAPVVLTDLQASPIAQIRSYEPDSMLLSWAPTTYPPGEFAGYVLRRRIADEEPQEAITLRTITAAGQTRWTDYWAPPNVPIIYGISQLRRIGADVLDSPVTEIEAYLPLTVPVLNSAYDGAIHATLMWMDTGLSGDFTRPETLHNTWGASGVPTLVQLPADYGTRSFSLEIELRNDTRGTMEEHLQDLDAIRRSGHPLCLRLERYQERIFCRLKNAGWKRGGSVGTRNIRLQLDEIAYVEGQTASI